ncbi:MAG: prepilin peptidase [Thermoguttaceae bacterium]
MSELNLAAWLLILWLSVLGAVFGSFLNVVIYRLPLGLSLIRPPSHCPKCGRPIRWYDNVPVLGWIALGGRCRQCRNPISIRYPIVEAVTGLLFGALGAVEMDRLDTSYPVHLVLLCTLLCAGLIEYDGHRPPWRLFLVSLVLTLAGRFFWQLSGGPTLPDWLTEWSGPTAGLAAALVWATALLRQQSTGYGLGLICVVLCLGDASLPILAASLLIEAAQWVISAKRRLPSCLTLGLLVAGWLLVGGCKIG